MAMNQQPRSLPPFAQWALTRRLPCAVLATLMYGTVLAFAGSVLSLPLLVLHVLTPALFALITLGGGLAFAMQVAVVAAVGVTLLTGGELGPGLLMLILYAALPVLAATTLAQQGGVSRSALNLAIGLVTTMLVVLMTGAGSDGGTALEYVRQLLAPLFEASRQEGMDPVMLLRIEEMTAWIFPGLTALCLWLVWWGNVMLARNIAVYYGFYRGDVQPVSSFSLPRTVAYGFMLLMLVASLAGGTPQYLAVNAGLVFAGLLSAQGLAVVHTWLYAKRLQIAAIVMYVMLLIQPAMVLPFAMIGLLDIWFDYRRNIMPADGGK
ncbi:MAG: DUF2232 domain-containing protein [Zetaproteobacteria bacterium CG12_big_fil_rev_8_21_14_0_65_55_1124]|nr:MAG: DUF2232 domain-containing protein [Zetaproteobacteria bacterium CG08_land_8_20_14_0_20_55_17]PIW43454.1 MAG: DUF2232 domain-containing protein [Zetaproteobacteria bacterium CG12_big_fil_rev_8_21_14_0_65_55_1124]PIY53989.1 MAG: DUF2232 domain-containing protein [Zetaproteobacteria bacterium CG_4_10_14_0_8_um_filter_55_43]PIZ39293.1 MAG: DUF2232 domain-containing protein [Zetaproteobacteria bacterium CG_4_10_14_0_2_um_filter_55_20]PJB81404.1 MAG: DUF2232 domain-containing protein [Zetapro